MTELTRLKRVATLRAGGTPTSDDGAMWSDDGLPWVTIADMTRERNVVNTDRRVSELGVSLKNLPIGQPGTVLFAMYASLGAVAMLGVRAAWNQAILGISPRHDAADAVFLQYWLVALRPQLAALARSNTQDNLNAGQVANLAFPLLPISTQRGIANYLDRETPRIDTLIERKELLLELIEARWQATLEDEIRRLVQDNGTEPLKYACKQVEVGIVITPAAWYAETGVPAIRGLNVKPGRISTDDLVYLTSDGDQIHAKSRLRSGDVVVVRTGQAGAAAVIPQELEGANCIDLVIIRPGNRLDPQYLELVLNSDWMQKHVDEYTVGTIQGHFNVSAAKIAPIPVPRRAEQEAVVAVLLEARVRRDMTVDCLVRQLELLREKRQALINAAVTGQFDVRAAG